jgi:outer membrane biosynthesis protein TonB
MEYQQEENNYPKAFAFTGVIMAVLIALCYLIVFHNPPKQEDGTGGILVNYGTTDEGMGNDLTSVEEPSKAEKPNHTKPTKVIPAPPTPQKTQVEQSDKKVVTQNTEDAPEVTSTAKKPSKTVATEPVTKPAKPTVNQNTLYKGKSNGATGEGDGTTNTPGNQGKPNGSTLTDNYNGTGSGNGGLQMAQRSFVSKPSVTANNREGKIVIDILVDQNGNVTSAKAGKGTMIDDYNLIQKCENAVLNAKLNASPTATESQPGKVVFVFKMN